MNSRLGVILAALATAAAGCGNYSTEDLRFLSALPRRQDLAVTVPASTGSGPTALTTGFAAVSATCASTIGDAEVWKWAKPTSDQLNGGVSWIIGLIDAVRQYSPTHRNTDSRRWGPFDAERHPGREIQVVIDRSWPNGQDGTPTYAYRFEARVKGTTVFTPLISGTFVGASAAHGDGDVTLDFDAFWAVGVNELDTPHGRMTIVYRRASDPVTTDLDLRSAPAGGFGAVSFGYGYAGYAAGGGAFDYAFQNVFNDRLEVAAGFDAAGAGRLEVTFYPSTGGQGSFRQCWDANACLVYVDDPANFTGSCAGAPCLRGDPAACVTVPAPPFTP